MPTERIYLLRELEHERLLTSGRLGSLCSIGDSSDELERMLAVLRFSFSKELKFVRARLGKPYNSALGLLLPFYQLLHEQS